MSRDIQQDISQTKEQHLAAYAELHCISNFSFLRGASHPEELVSQAAALAYRAIALTDECSLAGVVRAYSAAKAINESKDNNKTIQLIIGSEFKLEDGLRLVLLATDRLSYGKLSQLISLARGQAKKGEYKLNRQQLRQAQVETCFALWLPPPNIDEQAYTELTYLSEIFKQQLRISVELLLSGADQVRLEVLRTLSENYSVALCASGDVHMHQRQRRVLQDLVTAIDRNKPLSELGYELKINAEKHLRRRQQLVKMYPLDCIQETIRIANSCHFCLSELRYEYPDEIVPKNTSPQAYLRELTEIGIKQRWPEGIKEKARLQIEHELKLISELEFEPYFLTVYDIVRYARTQGILCQGRGSAANSAVCYCLGITEVDPARMNLLFERFISKERNETPDIDVDFEHERREEVIQYIYNKYGRHRAALAATVVSYQARSAIRDVGKAMGFSLDQVDRLAKSYQWWDGNKLHFDPDDLLGMPADSFKFKKFVELIEQLIGFPRHLSQHVGGFVISATALTALVPIENAAMQERTVIQWDKDDLEVLGLLKIDVLALGMLTTIRKALSLISAYSQRIIRVQDVPAEDPKVYQMLQKADVIGVFQIESRAQMSMLPRLKPANYYDLVIEIAIVRPGPIQGEMVHPYLARRKGTEVVNYPNEAVKEVLERTMGVPIFQEQVMQLAMVAAGFTAAEADQLRRSMAAWKRKGGLEQFEQKLLSGMTARGYELGFAQQIYKQILGFGEYGFPESHSASFALLAYLSAWIKLYHPSAFCCALLNSQPMGFYAPAQLIQDAQRHGVKLNPVDVCQSEIDCTLEYDQKFLERVSHSKIQRPDLRLGLRMVKGLSDKSAAAIIKTREKKQFVSTQDMVSRAKLNKKDIECLAASDALSSLEGHRHKAYWQVAGMDLQNDMVSQMKIQEADALLSVPSEGENVMHDYANIGLSLRRHPLALLRAQLDRRKIVSAETLNECLNDTIVLTSGIVINRQRPGTASGVVFVTLEDETGYINVIVWPKIAETQRKVLLKASLLTVRGKVQAQDGVVHVIAQKLEDYSVMLGSLQTYSRDFH